MRTLTQTTLAVLTLILSSTAFALKPMGPAPDLRSQKLSAAESALEQKINASLTVQQRSEIEALAADDVPPTLTDVSYGSATKAIYCVGGAGSAGLVQMGAACVHIWSGQVYAVRLIGAGYALNLQGMVFRLQVSYDASRYAADFDPIPGKYGTVSRSLTVGLGLMGLDGDSGNKSLSAVGLTLFAGVDVFSFGFMLIE